MASIDDETIRERQSRVQRAGRRWEDYVYLFLRESLEDTDIEVLRGTDIDRRSELGRRLSLPLKSSLTEECAWGDVDLVAALGEFPIALISCKLSLHGRFTETLFYSILFRLLTKTKVVLATPDAGRGQAGRWSSEWGTPERPTKDRQLARSYLDGVYVENVPEFTKNRMPHEHTVLGGIVQELNALPGDILRWSSDVRRLLP